MNEDAALLPDLVEQEVAFPPYEVREVEVMAASIVVRFLKYVAAKRMVKRMRKRSARRLFIVKEVLSTEEVYVANLKVLAGVYLNPLRACANGPSPLCTTDDIRNVFSNLEGILAFHCSLLSSLRERILDWRTSAGLGDIFLHLSPYLKLYKSYCNNYELALQAYEKCLEKEDFSKFVDICTVFPETQNLTFISFLIMPVQRIPRYRMLLEDLLANTETQHPDYIPLGKALQEMKQIADFVNHQMRIEKSFKDLQRIIDRTGAPQELLFNVHRYFVAEGSVKILKLSGIIKTLDYYLLNDTIIFYTSTRDWKAQKLKSYELLELPGCWLHSNEKLFKEKYQLEFITGDGCYHFLFESEEKKQKFQETLQATLDSLYQRHPALIREPFIRKTAAEGIMQGPAIPVAVQEPVLSPREKEMEEGEEVPYTELLKVEPQRTTYRIRKYDTVKSVSKPLKKEKASSSSSWGGLWGPKKPTVQLDRETATQEGYLRKRGALNPMWKKRFFSVIDGSLYYFKSEMDNVPLGCIALRDSSVIYDEKDKDFSIQITSGGKVTYLSATSKLEQQVWVRTLRPGRL